MPTPHGIERREVPADLGAWQDAPALVALVVGRYGFAVVLDPVEGETEAGPRLLAWTAAAATFPAQRAPVWWRVSALRTRGERRRLQAWAHLAGRDAEGDVVELAVTLRRT